jgi:Alr-MurF fusion protein
MIHLDDLLTVGGVVHGSAVAGEFADWCYDSRLAAPGQLFLALKTDRRDGHAFIADAVRAGCTGVLCEHPPAEPVDATIIVVPDVRNAIGQWASAILRRYNPLVIGITGSVGKTSTKRAVAAILEGLAPTFASRRSFNSLFGLPIALGRLEPHHRFAVLEMGVDRFGEMEQLTRLFPPTIAIVTNVAPTHLRYLRDEDHIAAEKAALVKALPPDGLAILNADDPRVAAMAELTRAKVVWINAETRGRGGAQGKQPQLRDSPRLRASALTLSADGTEFELELINQSKIQNRKSKINLLGAHSVQIALTAIAVALHCGMELDQAIDRLRLIERQAGRLNPLPGINGSLILDDTYNASPASMHAALDTLNTLHARRRIAVLGDMLELGDQAERLHREIGIHAQQVADVVVTKGDLATNIALPDQSKIQNRVPGTDESKIVHTVVDALAIVKPQLQPGDLVLVKGSAEARMEQVVRGLLAPHVDPAAVLVRQERAFETVRVVDPARPTWLEIDLGVIANNTWRIKALVGPGVRVLVTLKADAYGHGAIRVARTVLQHGAWGFAVATLGEALALRDAGIAAPILILGYTPPWQVRDAIRRGVRITIFDEATAREVSAAAQDVNGNAILHVKVDTGMARLGLQTPDVLPFMRLLRDLPGIAVEGLFTHFATADSADETFAREQLRRFNNVLAAISAEGLRPPLVHAANSAAILRFPASHFDLVRPGLAIYGLAPSAETPLPPEFQPALQWKTEIAQIKQWPAGTPISYGGTFITQRSSRIATVPVGYADGFRRSPAWREVLMHGRRVPVVGRVAMDYAMLDVTDVPETRSGDEVVLIGRQGQECISAEEVAGWLGTINYEVIAAILPRVPRVS